MPREDELQPLHPSGEGDPDRFEALLEDSLTLSEDPSVGPFPEPQASDGEGRKGKREERSGIIESLVLVLIALVLALTLKTYVAEAYEIKGRSMQTTFSDGERVVVLKSFFSIERGDIIVFASGEDSSKDLIKRVVGLPGELVTIEDGEVYIDGERIEEDYAKHDARRVGRDTSERVGRDQYFVLGDNRPDSHDSRYFGSIPASSIKGKVVVRWWPLSHLSAF